jgi:hypothetical protein
VGVLCIMFFVRGRLSRAEQRAVRFRGFNP